MTELEPGSSGDDGDATNPADANATDANAADANAASGTVTRLLAAWSAGDHDARDDLVPLMYPELRKMAARSLRRERRGHTLEATALVNEAYMRLVGQDRIHWRNRAQFFGIASELMRRILVDHARKRRAAKRDGGICLTFEDGSVPAAGSATRVVDLVDLDDVLKRLQELDPRQARVVEMRYFAGLKTEEVAAVLGVSGRTVKREWRLAKAWLKRELKRGR